MVLKGLGGWATVRGGLLLAAFSAALLCASPATAGSYNVYPESGSGSLSISSGGGSSSTSLSDPNIWESLGYGGTVSYSYTETWRYSWEPEDEYEDDLPEETVYDVYGTAQWDFSSNSGAWFEGGAASGSASMGASTASASMTVAQGGTVTDQQNCGIPQQLHVQECLSGWDGTFSITYAGTMTLAAVMQGTITITRGGTSGPVNKYIYIMTPPRNSTIYGYQDSLTINGVWKNPKTSPSDEYQVRWDPGNLGALEPFGYVPLTVYPMNTWNTWNGNHYFDYGGPYQVNAALEYKNAAGSWVSGSGPAWWTETRFTVAHTPPSP